MRGALIRNTGSEITSSGPAVTMTVSGTAVSFAATDFPANARTSPYKYVMLQVQSNPVRIGYGGDVPTATVGERHVAGDESILTVGEVLVMKFISEGSDAKIWALPCNLG